MRYVGPRELTEGDKLIARKNYQGFEHTFLLPGVKLTPRYGM